MSEPTDPPSKRKRTADWRTTERAPSAPTKHVTDNKKIPIAKVAEALRKSGGLYADAARILGVRRQTIFSRVKSSKELQAAVEEARAELLDLAESKLVKAIKKGNLGAICFFLKTQGKGRGYVEKTELAGTDGAPVAIQFYLPKKEPLPDEEPLATLPRTTENAPPSE